MLTQRVLAYKVVIVIIGIVIYAYIKNSVVFVVYAASKTLYLL
jgi:hypothetical protein